MSINERFQDAILPVIVTFIIYDIVGFIGNLTVLYIYMFRYQKNRFRLLVLWLSIIDFTSCCSTVPMETVSTWLWFSAPSRELCKVKNFFVQWSALSAMYLLFVTAVYKYRQICKPFGKQASQKMIIVACICGLAFSFMFATPAAILWDVNNYEITVENLTEVVSICEVHTKFQDTIYPSLYRHLLSVYAIFLLTTVVLYVCVAKATITHYRRLKHRKMPRPAFDNPAYAVDVTSDQTSGNNTVVPTDDNKENRTGQDNVVRKAGSQLTPGTIRKIVIMVILAGSFSLTFFTGLSFGYVFAMRGYDDYKSLGDIVLLFSFYRFYFINYSLNPVVYFSLDGKFRKQVKKFFSFC